MINYNSIIIFTLLCQFSHVSGVELRTKENETIGLEGCTYLEADVDYGEGGRHDHVDACLLPNGKIVDVIGLSEKFKKSHEGELLSGDTNINITGIATLKKGALIIEDEEQLQMQKLDINNKIIAKSDGSSSSKIIKKVFVLRANALDTQTGTSAWGLQDYIFGTRDDTTNLKTQYEACSHGQIVIEPISETWNGQRIYNGVGEVNLNRNLRGADKRKAVNAIIDAADEKYGNIYQKVEKGEVDLVMVCVPGGTAGDWVAYAYANGWLSVYNNNYCRSLSAQMHEVGHNLGLAHSGEATTYDDRSGMLGYSSNNADGPLKCFNGAKSWQLGLYSNGGHEIIYPLAANGGKVNYQGRLIGGAEYNLLNTSSTDKVIVQINGYELDYYVSFNAKKGANSETGEGGNQVLIHSRPPGQDYQASKLEAKLSAGQEHSIKSSIIRVDNIVTTATPSYADVYVGIPPCASNSDCDQGEFCTEYTCDLSTGTCSAIQDCSKCGGSVDIEIMTDRYGQETTWELVNVDNNNEVLAKGGPYPSGYLDEKHKCVGNGNYELKMYDKSRDGMCCIYGNGYYKLYVDDEVKKEGGEFGESEIIPFEISNPDAKTPTKYPTTRPTKYPTRRPTKYPTKQPTKQTPIDILSENGNCAPENKVSVQCGAKASNTDYDECCPGLVCNTNRFCVKAENVGCSWIDQGSKECGNTWHLAPDVCCNNFVCDYSTEKCVQP